MIFLSLLSRSRYIYLSTSTIFTRTKNIQQNENPICKTMYFVSNVLCNFFSTKKKTSLVLIYQRKIFCLTKGQGKKIPNGHTSKFRSNIAVGFTSEISGCEGGLISKNMENVIQ